jgi:3-phenylpropionate/cinnamic acid dioxygenase small subunit
MASALEEKDAIRDVLAEYCFRLDGGRFDDMAALFTEDGTWDTAFGKATGRPAIVELVRSIRARSGATPPRGIHMVANVIITLDGTTRARVRSNWTVVQNGPDGPTVGSGGSYADDMVKGADGAWRFHSRKIDRFIAPGA